MAMTGLEQLREAFPWPDEKPDVKPIVHGWFAAPTREMLDRFLPTDGVVLELGTWVGLSASYLAGKAGHVVCIDHWKGSPEHHRNEEWKSHLPTLYETCVVNLWEQRERITLVRFDTLAGVDLVAAAGVEPALIYVDADHSTEAVLADLGACNAHWPGVPIVGDDFTHGTVKAAIEAFERDTNRTIRTNHTAYAFEAAQ